MIYRNNLKNGDLGIPWRAIQKENFTKWEELASFLELPSCDPILKKSRFPLNLPRRLAAKIQKGSFSDPILRQFLPTLAELAPQGCADPVQDKDFQKTSCLLHKYQGRMLIVTTGACAMNCRFCFRQNYDYEPGEGFTRELAILAADKTIDEVLLSGGDPLSLSNEKLANLLEKLADISHIKRIRFHTRFPIGIPERIDEGFLALMKACSKQIIFVIHVNCAEEMDDDVVLALKKVAALGVPVLSQSTLLRGVNDSLPALKKLFLALINRGIIPYYLHQLDPVKGALHFEVPLEEGQALMKQLHAELPGYALPRYVREEPHAPGKTFYA